jgi:hypothetical protein
LLLDLLGQSDQFPELALQIVQGVADSGRPVAVGHLASGRRMMGLVDEVPKRPHHGQDIVGD